MADYYQKGDVLTYPQLVMKQIAIIQSITSKELRDTKRTIMTPIGEQTYDNDDTRYSYLQSIELLGSLLYPYFDEDTTASYMAFKDFYEMELVDALEDKDFKKSVIKKFNLEEKQLKQKITTNQNEVLVFLLNEKIKSARNLFRDLMVLFKEQDYLASQSYGDTSSGGSINESEDVEVVDED